MKTVRILGKIVKYIVFALLSAAVCAVIILGTAIGLSYRENQDFKETFYEVTSRKVDGSLRILQLSDLHAVHYDRLLERAELLEPDLIVLTGDIVDHETEDDSEVIETCGQLAQIAPVYYVYGNHERIRQFGSNLLKADIEEFAQTNGLTEEDLVFSALPDPLREKMEAAGVNVLMNEQDVLQVGNNTIDVFGLLTTSSEAFYEYVEDSFYQYAYQDEEHFKLMLIHEPYLIDAVVGEDWGDLILCGHTHGGIIRLPYLGGVYEDQYGYFPEVRGGAKIMGKYMVDDISMIVSSGLSNREIWRINNQPELIIVDINHY